MKSRQVYKKTLKDLEKMNSELTKKYGNNLGDHNSISAFKLGYQARITDEFIEKGVKI